MRALRVVLSALFLLALSLAIADVILDFFFPPELMAELCMRQLDARSSRQFRIAGAGAGVWHGVWLRGFQVSEAAGFSAGTFLEADSVKLRPRFSALLRGRIVADDAALEGAKIHITRRRDGRFNFSDLLPKSDSQAAKPPVPKDILERAALLPENVLRAAAGLFTVELAHVRVDKGEAVYTDPAASLNLVATDVNVSMDGLSLSGKVREKADFKLNGAYAGWPVQAEVSLENHVELRNLAPISSAGKLNLMRIRHPNFDTDLLQAQWDLRLPPGASTEAAAGFTPFLSSAEGVLRIDGSPGEIVNPSALTSESRWARLLLYPVDVLARAQGLQLPQMDKIAYSELRGEYSFQAGSVNIAPLFIKGPLLSLNAEGVIQLRRQAVGLKANLRMGRSVVGVTVEGPLDHPRITSDVAFSIKSRPKKTATIQQKLEDAADIVDHAFQPDAPKPDSPNGE